MHIQVSAEDPSRTVALGAGEFFGEMGLIDDEPRSASVITIESCDFMAINKDSFK